MYFVEVSHMKTTLAMLDKARVFGILNARCAPRTGTPPNELTHVAANPGQDVGGYIAFGVNTVNSMNTANKITKIL